MPTDHIIVLGFNAGASEFTFACPNCYWSLHVPRRGLKAREVLTSAIGVLDYSENTGGAGLIGVSCKF
eukprot:5683725-Amphidinium_carterae.1